MNAAIWGIFLNTTLQAAVNFGQHCEVHLRFVKNHLWKSLEKLFNETRRLIRDQTEIIGMKTIEFKELTWRSTSLLCTRANQISNTKTYVFSDSVLCVRKMGDDPIATWKSKIKWYSENNHSKELSRIDSMLTEFEWKIFPGFTTLDILEEIQQFLWKIYIANLSSSTTGSSSCQCTTTLYGEKRKHGKVCSKFYYNCEIRSQIPLRLLVFLGIWIRKGMVWDLF